MRLTRRGWLAVVGAIFIAAFGIGAATADVCWWGRCGPNDNPPPSIGSAWSSTCPTSMC